MDKLTKEQILEEIEYCANDIIYFKNTYLTSLDKKEIQDEMLEFIDKNDSVCLNTEKGTYKTTSVEIYLLHKLLFGKNEQMGISGTTVSNKEIIEGIKKLYEELPDFLKIDLKFLKTSIKSPKITNNNLVSFTKNVNNLRGRTLDVLVVESAEEKDKEFIDEGFASVAVNQGKIITVADELFEKVDKKFTYFLDTVISKYIADETIKSGIIDTIKKYTKKVLNFIVPYITKLYGKIKSLFGK